MYIDNNFLLDVSRGLVPNCSLQYKFGQGTITSSLTTVWTGAEEQPGLYIRPSEAGEFLYLSSTSVNDVNLTGTGAWSVIVVGHDVNHDQQVEEIKLNGRTQVSSINKYTRVCRMYVGSLTNQKSALNDSGTIGKLYLGTSGATLGMPTGTIYAEILDSGLQRNQTQMSCFSVPRGYSVYIYGYEFSAAATNKIVQMAFYTREFNKNGVWRARTNTILIGEVHTTSLSVPFKVDELTDIEVRGITDTGTDTVTISYLFLLEKN